MNDGMYSSETGEWGTPQDLFDRLNDEFDFTVDAAASKKNAKCRTYYDIEKDALNRMMWSGRVFLNPPYGRGVGVWVDKVVSEVVNCEVIVALLPARTDTSWWRKAAANAIEVRFLSGRLKFEMPGATNNNSAPFPSCVMVFRPGYKKPRRGDAGMLFKAVLA